MKRSGSEVPKNYIPSELIIDGVSVLIGGSATAIGLWATPEPKSGLQQPTNLESVPTRGSYCEIRPKHPSCIVQTPISFGLDHFGWALAYGIGTGILANLVCRFFPWPTPKSNENR